MIDMTLLPNRGWLLVEVIEPEKTTEAGLVLPDTVEDEPMYGKVVQVGLPLVKEGGVTVEPPRFLEVDKDGHNVKDYETIPGVIVIYKQHTQHEIPGERWGKTKLAFVNFESVIGIKLE